jgi:hypothetical protein
MAGFFIIVGAVAFSMIVFVVGARQWIKDTRQSDDC